MGRSDITFEPVQDDGGLQARLEIRDFDRSGVSDLRLPPTGVLGIPGAGAKHS